MESKVNASRAAVGRRSCDALAGRFFASLVLLVSLGVQVPPASAQSALEVMEKLNAEAMEAFTNMDIGRAGAMLEEALRVAAEGKVTGRPLALSNLNMGIIYVAGLNEVEAGTGYFADAVCADSTVELDPLHSSPEIQEAFAAAQAQVAEAGDCKSAGASAQSGRPAIAVEPIVHVPPAEQQTQTPLPIYAQIAPGLGISRVYLLYKSLGMDDFKRVEMVTYQEGVAYQISCNDVFEPSVSYYIEAQDDTGAVVATLGAAAEAMQVQITTAAVAAGPALPGSAPPMSCVASECPPGLECDRPGTAAMGDDCAESSECQSGLACTDDVCAIAGAGSAELPSSVYQVADDAETPWGGSDEGDEGGADPEFKRFFVDASLVLGLPWIGSGMPVDRNPPTSAVFVDAGGNRIVDPQPGQPVFLADDQMVFPDKVTEWVPDADSADSTGVGINGPCPADGIATGPGTDQLFPSSYCARVKSSGFAPQGALRFAVGYFVTDALSLAAVTRIQLSSGVSALSNLLFGVRGEYALTALANNTLVPTIFVGATLGQIQAQPDYSVQNPNSPWIKSGLMGIHVGANLRFRLHKHFGLIVGPEVDLQFPDVLFNIDLPVGVEVAF